MSYDKVTPVPEGLRERKKQRSRKHISAVATELFVDRGFDAVAITEVAMAAEVSVNTVYNYFRTKEDLVFPPDEASPRRLADIVQARGRGTSAACSVLECLRRELRSRDRRLGLTEGFGPVYAMMRSAPTLIARLDLLGEQMVANLTQELINEVNTSSADLRPYLVASQIGWAHSTVFAEIGSRVTERQRPEEIASDVLELVDVIEELLSDLVLQYATKAT